MTRAEYQRYLASREWAVLKEQVRQRSRGLCERCARRPYEQTHHVTYERIGAEHLDDLLGVCGLCHEYLSAKRASDPKQFLTLCDEEAANHTCAGCELTEVATWSVWINLHRVDLCITCLTRLASYLDPQQFSDARRVE
jgi:hypothetical protein